MANIDLLTGDLEVEVDWDLADITGGPNLGSLASTCGDYKRVFRRARWLVCLFLRRMLT